MKLTPMIRTFAVTTLLLAAGRADAQAYFTPRSGQLLAQAQIYTEENVGSDFNAFVDEYSPSSRLEAAIWDLTSNSDTLAKLADMFGWSDPWEYRRAAQNDASIAPDRG